jgi:hypothetical protein
MALNNEIEHLRYDNNSTVTFKDISRVDESMIATER